MLVHASARAYSRIALVTSLVFGFGVSVAEAGTLRSTLQATCVLDVLQNPVSQTDPELTTYRVEGGGLCGPACLVNIIQSGDELFGKTSPDSRQLMHVIASMYSAGTKKKVGLGVPLEKMAQVAKKTLKWHGYPEVKVWASAIVDRMSWAAGERSRGSLVPSRYETQSYRQRPEGRSQRTNP